jgi:hypothetical protein
MSDRNTRQWISDTLVSLPAKTKNKSLVGRLRQFSQNAANVKSSVELSIENSKRLRTVFPGAEVAALAPKLSDIRKKAKAASRVLAGGVDAVAKQVFENKMIEMVEIANGIAKPLLEMWQRRIDEAITPFIRISQVVADLKLTGASGLQEHVVALQTARAAIPDSPSKALVIKQRLESLPSIVGGLGLTGKAGRFLVAVAERNGSARDLDDEEIRLFLNRYELWGALRVSFGDLK